MASIIKIKRSETTGQPTNGALSTGELAYSSKVGDLTNGGDRLYIGTTNGNNVVIGGKYFTDKLDHAPGTLTASSALIVDSNSKLDNLQVDNIDLNGNTISTTNTDGNLVLSANGAGNVVISSQTFPRSIGLDGQFLKTDASGVLTWASIPSGSFTIAGNTNQITFTTGNTLDIKGSGAISTTATANTITISAADATTTSKGVASFNSSSFDVTSGGVSIKASGVSNTQLANSSVTIGNTSVSLGSTVTAFAGLTELTVDNLNFNLNTITASNTGGGISLVPNGSGTVDVSNSRITSVAEPTDAQDAATKTYVDSKITGLTWKIAVNLLAEVNVPLTGTVASMTSLNIDSYGALTNGFRLLLTNQSTPSEKGIYVYNVSGLNYTLIRSTDTDTVGELIGAAVFVSGGMLHASSGWVQSVGTITNFSDQVWVQFSGAGAYVGGAGLTLSGTTFNINVSSNSGLLITNDFLELDSAVAGGGLTYTNGVIDVVGTANRIAVNNNSIDIASSYVGQTSITTLGSVTVGTWNATTIATTKGGTGLTSYSTGDLVYASASNTLSNLTSGSAGQVLQMVGGLPAWGDIDGGTY